MGRLRVDSWGGVGAVVCEGEQCYEGLDESFPTPWPLRKVRPKLIFSFRSAPHSVYTRDVEVPNLQSCPKLVTPS